MNQRNILYRNPIATSAAVLLIALLLTPSEAFCRAPQTENKTPQTQSDTSQKNNRKKRPAKKITQTITGSPHSIQAGGDVIINPPPAIKNIQSLSIEARLTCTLKDGAQIPPAELPIIRIGGVDASFSGPSGNVMLKFESPLRFRRQDNNEIVVISHFSLPADSDLQSRLIESLKNYDKIHGHRSNLCTRTRKMP